MCREHNNQPSTGAVKVMDGQDKKRVTTAAGKGRQWQLAANCAIEGDLIGKGQHGDGRNDDSNARHKDGRQNNG